MLDILFLAVVAGLLPGLLLAGWLLPKPAEAAAPEGEAFVPSGGVKTLLLSGAALVIWSGYLFFRTYWTLVPDIAKFFGFALLGLAAYGTGATLTLKGWVSRTARTLIGLGLLLMPCVAYAARVWLWPQTLSSFMAWALGLAAMSVLAASSLRLRETWEAGFLCAAGAAGTLGLAALNWTADPQKTLALSAAGAGGAALLSALWHERTDASRGAFHAALCVWVGVMGTIVGYGFFWVTNGQLFTALALGLLGATAAWAGRDKHPFFAVPAAAAFAASGAVLLRHFDLPIYQYGYVFGPMGLVALWRAHTWEKAGEEKLARTAFWFGHAALAASLLAVAPTFTKPGAASLPALMGVLFLVGAAYAAAGSLHKSPFYAYASAVTFLVLTGAVTRQTDAFFVDGVFYFTFAAAAILGLGLVGGAEENSFGRPLTVIGTGTLTVALALLGGKWGQELFLAGQVRLVMPLEQANAGLWTGGLGLIAYGFLAVTRRRGAFMYPALYSATWVYVCLLSKAGGAFTLMHVAGIVVASLVLAYVLEGTGQDELARGARLWGEVAFVFLGWASVASAATMALPAVLLSAAAFLPGLRTGRASASSGILASVFLIHYLLFRRGHLFVDPSDYALFALHGVAATCGVVFLRTAVSRLRPEANVLPFRLGAVLYASVGLGLSLQDMGIAWQVFLAYGALAVAVSLVHYEGRYWGVGAALILAGVEMFFHHHGFREMEVFTWPLGLTLLALGIAKRGTPDLRDFLYGFAMIVLFGPSSALSLDERWGSHGTLLAVMALILIVVGILLRNRVLVLGAGLAFLADALYQSRSWLFHMPRWASLGLAGFALIVIAGLFEFRREDLGKAKDAVLEEWKAWE